MPVQYKDLGKQTKDLFEKNYEHGKYSLEVKSKAPNHEFTTKGHQDASGKLASSMEHKMKLCKLGTLKATVKPGNSKFAFDLENGSAVKDSKFNLLFNMGATGCPVPNVEALKVNYKNSTVNVDLETDLGKTLKLAAVTNCEKMGKYSLGFNGAFDLGKSELSSKELAVHFADGPLDITCKSNCNFSSSGAWNLAILNKINNDLTLATKLTHSSNGSTIALAGAAAGACGSTNQFKIDHKGIMAFSHITPTNFYGAKFTVGAEFDAFNLGSGSHKVGMGLKFDL